MHRKRMELEDNAKVVAFDWVGLNMLRIRKRIIYFTDQCTYIHVICIETFFFDYNYGLIRGLTE